MTKFKNIKKLLLHLVCMIMLVLIQFDVCGYDLMRACQLADKPALDYAMETDFCIDDADDNVSIWSNPVYRGVNPRSLIKATLVEFSSMIFLFYQRELPLLHRFTQFFQAKWSNPTYLRFCVLLI